MPINVPNGLPAIAALEKENIFVMTEERAQTQDIRPLRIVILNLMPKKIETETQLLRLLGNTPLQVDVELLQTASHQSKNTPAEHLVKFYCTFDQIKQEKFDGMVITGALWSRWSLKKWTIGRSYVRLWSGQKPTCFPLSISVGGPRRDFITITESLSILCRRKNLVFFFISPVLPCTGCCLDLMRVLGAPFPPYGNSRGGYPKASGTLYIGRQPGGWRIYRSVGEWTPIFCHRGHSEYDRDTLAGEYFRDVNKGLPISVPKHYFPQDDPTRKPPLVWRGHSGLLFANWLNYFVYQRTPYELSSIGKDK